MSKSSRRRILPLVLLLSLAAALALVSSFPAPTAAAPGPMQAASSTTTFSTTGTTTYTSLSSSFTSTTTVMVTGATTSTLYTGTRTTGVTSLFMVTATTTPVLTLTTTSTSTTRVVSFPSSNPSCAMAVVAVGSVLEPYANSLRGFRDSQILKTSSGQAFMWAFNGWYYSWAPFVARAAVENGMFADALRVGLVPLFGILYASRYSYLAGASLNPEFGAITAGVVAAWLIGIVYVAPITYAVGRVLRLRRHLFSHATPLILWTVGTALMIGAAFVLGSFALLGLATASLTLSMLTLGSIFGARALACFKPSMIDPALILSIKPFKQEGA